MPQAIALPSSFILFLLDVAVLLLVWPIAVLAICPETQQLHANMSQLAASVFLGGDLLALYALGLYRREAIVQLRQPLARVPLVVVLGVLGSTVVLVLLSRLVAPIPSYLRMLGLAVIEFSAAAVMARLVFAGLQRGGRLRRKLLVVGAGARAYDLVLMLRREGRHLLYEILFVHDPAFGDVDARLREAPGNRVVEAGAADLLALAGRERVEQIVVAPDERRGMALETLLACKVAGFPVIQYLTFLEHEIRRVDIKRIELAWLLYTDGFSFGPIDRVLKRSLDIVVSTVLLVVLSPFLIGAAAVIWFQDRGPVIYSQERVTQGGRIFRIRKFRTMRTDAESQGAVWARSQDDRVTKAGRFLRRTRIDEMPQLFDVFRGSMSLVGPRPERPQFVAELAAQLPLYQERHTMKAGLTGWAQINYPYGASVDDARSKLSYDLYYVKNYNIFLDLVIILQTLRVVLFPSGVR